MYLLPLSAPHCDVVNRSVRRAPSFALANTPTHPKDHFEDAVDTGSIRSLTARKSSVAAPRPQSIASTATGAHDETAAEPDTDDVAETIAEEEDGVAEEPVVVVDHDEDDDEDDGDDEDMEIAQAAEVAGVAKMAKVAKLTGEPVEAVEAANRDKPEPESARADSPVSHADMDNVDLGDDAAPKPAAKGMSTGMPANRLYHHANPTAADVPPAVPPKSPGKKLSLSNLTSSLPPMPWSPSESPAKTSPNPARSSTPPQAAVAPEKPPAPERASTGRKLVSPFSWLSRGSTAKETVSSPPTAPSRSPRRNTASSVATLTSNPEMMLSRLEEGVESTPNGRPKRNSLRDRFKLVRMREEAGITLEGEDDNGQPVLNQASALGISNAGTDAAAADTPLSPIPASPNQNLAPGTVSGVSAGPSTLADSQVDWDLWQSVVYEGPSAVAKTSPEELNRAIATGVPNVIRGVVWQVLAQSKNDDLELVYKELSTRGTERSSARNSNATSISSANSVNADKETVASSASSVHSDNSSGAHSAKSAKSAPPAADTETAPKAQLLTEAERKQKEKDEAEMIQRLEKVIKRDLGARTSFSKHAQAAGLQDGLLGVCKAYALYDEPVGYAQGMNFLIMPLLFNMPEEEAFCLLVRLMNHYKLRDLFIQDMPGLHMHLYQFERLLEDFEPALYCHLHRRGISPHLYATQWFLTLFAYRFPLQLVLRIYDLILSEGLSAIIKFGIVLMQKNSEKLLTMSDMGVLTTFLRDKLFDVYIDQAPSSGSLLENGFFGSSSSSVDKEVYRADEFVRDACEVKITPELLKAYTAEWEEKTRAEKEREQELDTLKKANASFTIRVRKLEARLEAADTEQTAMANELVHTKIENEELKDENESLTGQVKELRIVIDKQPQEIEDRWKLERDNLMERNQKVHEENEKLEKEMAELEEELVQTKMRWAEVCATPC
jgi:hypothetical protein